MSNEKTLEKFYPTPVSTLENYLRRLIVSHELFDKYYEIRKNIVYSFQYLEYLNYTLSSEQPVKLTDVIERMTVRNFIITGMSIIEGILHYMLRINNLHKKKREELVATFISEKLNVKKTTKLRQVTNLYKVLDDDIQEMDDMDLHNMINKAQDHKVLGNEDKIYKDLKYLKRLRNTIHLQGIQEKSGGNYDIIYHKFSIEKLNLMKKTMYDFLLISKILNPSQAQKEFPYLISPESLEINNSITDI